MFEFTLCDLLEKNLGSRAKHSALVSGAQSLSYQELHANVERLAAWLYESGIRRGDRIGIHLPKSFEEVIAMFASARIGAVFVNVFSQWTSGQLDYVINDCGIKLLITDERRARALMERPWPPTLSRVLVTGQVPPHPAMESWAEIPEQFALTPAHTIDADLAAILYTSGSTGLPKGVVLTHQNIVSGARSVARYVKLSKDDRVLSPLAFCFDYGLNQLTTMCLVGGTLILQSVVMPMEIIKGVVRSAATGLTCVPPSWIQIVQCLATQPADFPALRFVTNTGGSIPRNILELMPKVFPGAEIYLMYGLTEAFRSTFLPPDRFHEKMGSIGMAVPNVETYIVNERGICGPGDEGELVHRGSFISRGYWGKPQATDEKIRSCPQLVPLIGDEKVCYSGDTIRIDEDGYYWFVSRNDEMIKTNSIRVSPTEIEEWIHSSNLVADVVAFGVDDAALGQVVHAVIVPRDNGLDFELDTMQQYCLAQMPPYMIPRVFHVWREFMPRTASGKIDRPIVIRRARGLAEH